MRMSKADIPVVTVAVYGAWGWRIHVVELLLGSCEECGRGRYRYRGMESEAGKRMALTISAIRVVDGPLGIQRGRR